MRCNINISIIHDDVDRIHQHVYCMYMNVYSTSASNIKIVLTFDVDVIHHVSYITKKSMYRTLILLLL